MTNVLILGAAGEISQYLTDMLLKQTSAHLTLYARQATQRLRGKESNRVILVDGDFQDTDRLVQAMKGIDIVYVNDMYEETATNSIVEAMERAGVKRIIAASSLGIYDEVGGEFGKWLIPMSQGALPKFAASAAVLEQSTLDYTLLRITWMYNEDGNTNYMLTNKGEPFIGAQVTRQAVAQLVVDIIQDNSRFIRSSLGVSEPGTDWAKPSFY
ncbi:NAD(P)H-binding protein [Paenibacillus sp. DMB5]|uniref:NAD(P)H-binding protein n=1 Tax=Paenibacillus sp. DMB5 TaxID=1780103 RepID=UPI00076D2810|nr:NAD(P)H-binding protein [Paenibacillus sp. DMB5]KUP25906.1 SAM-dependent methyltransferase [Paenibacillus sp. DMB5]